LQPPETASGLIATPIRVAPGSGEQIASLQFDLAFDTTSVEIVAVEAGASASQALKDVVFSNITDGSIRVIVAGMNQNTMDEGVVAVVYTRPLKDLGGSSSPQGMELDSIVLADPVGRSVEVKDGTLAADKSVAASSKTSEPERDSGSVGINKSAFAGDSRERSSGAAPERDSSGTGAYFDSGARSSVLGDVLKAVLPDGELKSQHLAAPSEPSTPFGEYPAVAEEQSAGQRVPKLEGSSPGQGTGRDSSAHNPVSGNDPRLPTRNKHLEKPNSSIPGPLAMANTAFRKTAGENGKSLDLKDKQTPQASSLDGRLLWVLLPAAVIGVFILARRLRARM
jgi:hypothetical protein